MVQQTINVSPCPIKSKIKKKYTILCYLFSKTKDQQTHVNMTILNKKTSSFTPQSEAKHTYFVMLRQLMDIKIQSIMTQRKGSMEHGHTSCCSPIPVTESDANTVVIGSADTHRERDEKTSDAYN